MANSANSTPAPSRRQFFGSAVAAGWAAAQPPIFTLAAIAVADAALFAMRDELTALLAADEAAWKRYSDIEWTISAMVGPVAKEPARADFLTFNDYHRAMHHWTADCESMVEKRSKMEGPAGLIAAEDAATATSATLMALTADLAAMRATTLDGLIFKAGFLAGDQNALRDSIVDDLLALGGQS